MQGVIGLTTGTARLAAVTGSYVPIKSQLRLLESVAPVMRSYLPLALFVLPLLSLPGAFQPLPALHQRPRYPAVLRAPPLACRGFLGDVVLFAVAAASHRL